MTPINQFIKESEEEFEEELEYTGKYYEPDIKRLKTFFSQKLKQAYDLGRKEGAFGSLKELLKDLNIEIKRYEK